jgi:hypothetical protein
MNFKPLPPLRGCAVMIPYDHGLAPTATRFCRFTATRFFPTSTSKCPNCRHGVALREIRQTGKPANRRIENPLYYPPPPAHLLG